VRHRRFHDELWLELSSKEEQSLHSQYVKGSRSGKKQTYTILAFIRILKSVLTNILGRSEILTVHDLIDEFF
jgi:hypothetical protein